jgi:hypothetical protein
MAQDSISTYYESPSGSSSLMISGDEANAQMDAVAALGNTASSDAFGQIKGGVQSEPPSER